MCRGFHAELNAVMWAQVPETWPGQGKQMRKTVARSETKNVISWLAEDLNEVCPDLVPKQDSELS